MQGLWKVEAVNYSEGGFLSWEDSYRFKNFFTGKYLTVTILKQPDENGIGSAILE